MALANLPMLRQRIAAAALASGRPADSVGLVAVTKKQPLAAVLAAHAAGIRDFGENSAQDLAQKAAALAARGLPARWHFIGQLQRNKAALAAKWASCVHSVDSAGLAQALARRRVGPPLDVMLQVRFDAAPQRGGIALAAVDALAIQVAALPTLRLVGLMTVPPLGAAPETCFKQLAAGLRRLQGTPAGRAARHLSMGMSADFVAAIACGATMIRLGTILFGARPPRPEEKNR